MKAYVGPWAILFGMIVALFKWVYRIAIVEPTNAANYCEARAKEESGMNRFLWMAGFYFCFAPMAILLLAVVFSVANQ